MSESMANEHFHAKFLKMSQQKNSLQQLQA